jgi:hypothetical protein
MPLSISAIAGIPEKDLEDGRLLTIIRIGLLVTVGSINFQEQVVTEGGGPAAHFFVLGAFLV